MTAFIAARTGTIPINREDIVSLDNVVTKIEIDQTIDILSCHEDRSLFAPGRSEVEITTNTGQRYKAESITFNYDNTATASRVYPVASFGNGWYQTTATTSNVYIDINSNAYNDVVTDSVTNRTAFSDSFIPTGYLNTITFNTADLNLWPVVPVTVGMPSYFGVSAQSKREQLQAKIRNQMQPDLTKLFGHRPRAESKNFRNTEANELVALGLLKSMLETDVWKKYLTHHFVTIQGPSGLTYQIQRSSHNIIVWNKGTKVSSLCVYIQDRSIPPTDEVVAKMLICMYDEPDIWKRANVNWKITDNIAVDRITTQLGLPPRATRRNAFDLGARFVADDLLIANEQRIAA